MGYARRNISTAGIGGHVLSTVVEFDNSRRGEDPRPKFRFYLAALAALGALFLVGRFVAARVASTPRRGENPAALPVGTPKDVPAEVLEPREARRWRDAAKGRPLREQALFERLAAAEAAGDDALAIDTIEKIRRRRISDSTLDDGLARRLGALNARTLFGGGASAWTGEVKARKGDDVERIAHEHRTTAAAIRRLNGLDRGAEKIPADVILRLPQFPRARLDVHRAHRYADLMLNGKFFNRYCISPGPSRINARHASVEKAAHATLKAMGLRLAPCDFDELDQLLAPGSTVAEVAD